LRIDRDHEGLEARLRDALDQRRDVRDVSRKVGLKPRRRALLRDFFQPDQRRSAHDHRDICLRCRIRHDQVAAVGVQRADADRRDAERRRVGATEKRCLLRALRHVDEHARQEAELREGGAIVVQRPVRLDGAGHVAEDGSRQIAARGGLEVVEAKHATQSRWRPGIHYFFSSDM